MRPLREWVIELSILLGITLAVAALGPFGSYALGDYANRFLYWFAMIFGGYLLLRPLIAIAPGLAQRLALPELPVWLALMALAALPVTLLVWFGGGARGLPEPDRFLRLYPNVLILGGIVTLVFWSMAQQRRSRSPEAGVASVPSSPAPPAPAMPQPVAAPAGPRLLERVAPHQRGRVRALEMEDHYVRIHTDSGAPLLLLRMKDAVAELDGIPGEQVHRSWWVARDAVVCHETDGRNIRLHLEGGLVAPVSRANIPMLREKGWF